MSDPSARPERQGTWENETNIPIEGDAPNGEDQTRLAGYGVPKPKPPGVADAIDRITTEANSRFEEKLKIRLRDAGVRGKKVRQIIQAHKDTEAQKDHVRKLGVNVPMLVPPPRERSVERIRDSYYDGAPPIHAARDRYYDRDGNLLNPDEYQRRRVEEERELFEREREHDRLMGYRPDAPRHGYERANVLRYPESLYVPRNERIIRYYDDERPGYIFDGDRPRPPGNVLRYPEIVPRSERTMRYFDDDQLGYNYERDRPRPPRPREAEDLIHDRRDDPDLAEEAAYYNNRNLSRAFVGEGYDGATANWTIVDVPPGTTRVRMDGKGGAAQDITWQSFNGVRRSKFLPPGAEGGPSRMPVGPTTAPPKLDIMRDEIKPQDEIINTTNNNNNPGIFAIHRAEGTTQDTLQQEVKIEDREWEGPLARLLEKVIERFDKEAEKSDSDSDNDSEVSLVLSDRSAELRRLRRERRKLRAKRRYSYKRRDGSGSSSDDYDDDDDSSLSAASSVSSSDLWESRKEKKKRQKKRKERAKKEKEKKKKEKEEEKARETRRRRRLERSP